MCEASHPHTHSNHDEVDILIDAVLPPAKWELYWPEFAAAMTKRLAEGAAEYGEASFSRSDAELQREIEEEILDVVGWSFVRWVAMKERGNNT